MNGRTTPAESGAGISGNEIGSTLRPGGKCLAEIEITGHARCLDLSSGTSSLSLSVISVLFPGNWHQTQLAWNILS